MKVLMISSSYPQNAEDWRVRFVSDLVYAMAQKKQVELHLWAPPGEKPSSVISSLTDDESIWLRQLMDRGGIAHIIRSRGVQRLFVAIKLLAKLRMYINAILKQTLSMLIGFRMPFLCGEYRNQPLSLF